MEIEERKTVYAPLNMFDWQADESSFIQVTEWSNGLGYDIDIDNRHISLSTDEITAISYLTAHLRFQVQEAKE